MAKKLKVLSLFGGIECGRMALDKIGVEIESYHSSEFDEYPIKASSHNFPDIVHLGDVTKIDGSEFEGIDLLIGGPPCQDLSIAGARKGLSGDRSSKFFDYVRILRNSKPKAFMVENVASMPLEAKEEMIRELYGIEPVMINSSLVSAQNRKRFYWAGYRKPDGSYAPVIIPLPSDRGIFLKDILEDLPLFIRDEQIDENEEGAYIVNPIWKPLREEFVEKIKAKRTGIDKGYAVTATYSGACPQDFLRSNRTIVVANVHPSGRGMNGNVFDPEGKSPTLTTNKGEGNKILGVFQRPRGGNEGGIVQEGLKSPNMNASEFVENNLLVGQFRRTDLRIHADQEKSCTLTANMGTGGNNVPIVIDEQFFWRKLTVRECARLQTIPETYDFSPLSNSRAYKGIGNGWTVDVIEHILRAILEKIGALPEEIDTF